MLRTDTEQSQILAAPSAPTWRSLIVGSSPAMKQVLDMIAMIATRRSTVLITGETGCGKEVIARAIHAASPRVSQPFVPVNCAAIPKDLLETELFGHVKGAFGAGAGDRVGRFEQANQGTLLLDEIGDMALDLQAKLLRVLQDREFQRVGSSENVRVDVRVLAATNADLFARVKQGRFREDLYYRLHVVPLCVPPLRDRKSDIPVLAEHFIRKIAKHEGLPAKALSTEVVKLLLSYSWPGNVRQLENAIEMAMIVSGDRAVLVISDFSLPRDRFSEPLEMTADHLVKLPEEGLDFEAVVARIELDLLDQALSRTNGNKKVAADLLKLKRTTLTAKLKSLEETFPDLIRSSEPGA